MESQIDNNLDGVSRNDFFSMIPDKPDVYSNGTLVNPVLNSLHFRTQKDDNRAPENDAFLFYPLKPKQKASRQLLGLHPIAARSYASFPPARRVSIGGTGYHRFLEVENAFGVTMWDIQTVIQMKSGPHLSHDCNSSLTFSQT